MSTALRAAFVGVTPRPPRKEAVNEVLAPHHPPASPRASPPGHWPRRPRAPGPPRPTPARRPSSHRARAAPVVQTVDEGFDWDSAAIGAGGAGGLLLLVVVGRLHLPLPPRAHRRRALGATRSPLRGRCQTLQRRPRRRAPARRASLRGVGCPVHAGFDPLSAEFLADPYAVMATLPATSRSSTPRRSTTTWSRATPTSSRSSSTRRRTRRRPRSCRWSSSSRRR